MSDHGPLRTYGRIKSRPIKPRQAALLESLLPRLRVPAEAFDPHSLKPDAKAVWVEIGFGGGEHLAAQAAAHPDALLIGAEPFQNGMASALRHIDEQHLENVRLHDGDARELLARLPDASVERIFILFPDPWPKLRHHKRRLIAPAFVALLASRIASGGYLHCATDWQHYAEQMLEVLSKEPLLANLHDGYAPAPANPLASRPTTKFHARGKRFGHGVWDLVFVRR